MTVYGPEYIDLLLANSGYGKQLYNMAGIFSQMKAELLNKQLERYRNQYIPNMVKTDGPPSKKAQEVIKTLQDIGVTDNKIGDKLVESIQTELDSSSVEIQTSGSQIGNLTRSSGRAVTYQTIGNLSEENLGRMSKSKEEMESILNNLTDNLQIVIDDAESKVEQLYSAIEASSAIDVGILDKLAGKGDNNKELPTDPLLAAALGKNAAKKIQAFVLTPQEQAAVQALAENNPDAFNLVQNYSRIQGDIASLKYLKNGAISQGAIQKTEGKSKSQAVRQLVGKIGGSFSDASAVFSETVVATAASGALSKDDVKSELEKLVQEHVKTMVTKSGGIGDFKRVFAKVENDPLFQQDLSRYTEGEKNRLNAQNNKDDVFLSITSDEIAISFGITVKASAKSVKKGNQGKAVSLKLEQDTNLLHVFTTLANYDAGVSLPGIYNLAGGAVGDLRGYNVPNKLRARMWKEQRQDLYSKKSAEQAWEELVNYAETSYFLSALAGDGSFLNNSLFLSYNNKLIPISTILSGAASYVASGDNKSVASFRSGKKSTARQAISYQSNQFVVAKKGQTDEEAALERSAQAEQNLTEAFQKRKITTFLNTTFLTAVTNSL